MSPPNDHDAILPSPSDDLQSDPPSPAISASQQPQDQLASEGQSASESPESSADSSPAGGSGPDSPPPAVTFVEDLADPEAVWEMEGGVRNTAPNVKGKRKVLKGNPLDKKHGRRMTQELYESLWEAWRDGLRNKSRLCEMFNISWDTLSRTLDRGYPKQGWRAIKDRYAEHEAADAQAKRQARAVAEAISSDEFLKARQDNLKLLGAQKFALGHVVNKAIAAAQRCKFTKTKKQRDKEGHLIDVEVEPDAFEMADALKTLVSATKELGAAESFWLGGPESRTETVISGPPKGWQQLSPEQLQWIMDNGGELPPGITEEMLRDGIPPHVLASFQPGSVVPVQGPQN